ncbi:MAG: nitroreductase family protein [Anaerolineaceae bacterium]|nr:nitroreductase family protein [Anaerolineaceae bacterium]
MGIYSRPVSEIIQSRFSCRTFLKEALAAEKQQKLRAFMKELQCGPLGTALRFELVAAEDAQRKELRGLGTYGTIRGTSGYIVGAVGPGSKNLEDFGCMLEQIVLCATDLEIGTCWLGGAFTKSGFAKKIAAKPEERLPAVVAMGMIADEARARRAALRLSVGADSRLPWETLFFEGSFGASLSREKAGQYAAALEDLRLGPSASNKQPWRICLAQDKSAFHFYLQRTKGYPGSLATTLLRIDDLQRVDMGIGMCHFELSAAELGLNGHWMVQEPPIAKPQAGCEYTVSWFME